MPLGAPADGTATHAPTHSRSTRSASFAPTQPSQATLSVPNPCSPGAPPRPGPNPMRNQTSGAESTSAACPHKNHNHGTQASAAPPMPLKRSRESSSSSSSSTSSSSHSPARTRPAPSSPKLFFDLFAGKHAPLTAAMEELQADCFQPFDLACSPPFDILDDTHFRLALRIAASGIAAVLWSAPPCKEFSILKLRQPGPKAIRTPAFMDGVPDNSPEEQARVEASSEIHSRSRQVLRTAKESGSHTGMEQPPSSMAWHQHDNVTFLREISAHCAHVAACQHGMDFYKSWAMCASFPSIAQLACTCTHAPGVHKTIAGLKQGGQYVSALTAEYPRSLARQLAGLMAPFCSSLGHRRYQISDFANLLTETHIPRRPPVCDGAGHNSSADHSSPQASCCVQDVVEHWLGYVASNSLKQHIISHLAQGQDSHPLTEQQQLDIASIAHSCLHPNCKDPACLRIASGQPFRLQLLQAFAARSKDPDTNLHSFLHAGVPAGILQDIPSSMQWQQRQAELVDDDLDGVHLLHCKGNWTQAENNPKLLAELLQKEIESGWVTPFPGNDDAASARWPQGTAIGKLNIVTADGKEPRLVLDSTICNANTLCKVPERVSLPSALDVQRTFQQSDLYGAFMGLSLDFKAAHKSVKVSEQEHGCLLFRVEQRLYHYVVCHFGAKFSAYWWQRVGAQITRIMHALLSMHSHKAWLYVDDLLAMLARSS